MCYCVSEKLKTLAHWSGCTWTTHSTVFQPAAGTVKFTSGQELASCIAKPGHVDSSKSPSGVSSLRSNDHQQSCALMVTGLSLVEQRSHFTGVRTKSMPMFRAGVVAGKWQRHEPGAHT